MDTKEVAVTGGGFADPDFADHASTLGDEGNISWEEEIISGDEFSHIDFSFFLRQLNETRFQIIKSS